MSKVKVVLLGAGFIADIHVESYHRFVPEAEIVGVFSRDLKHARRFAKRHGVPRTFASVAAAIHDSGCDVVDVCLPNFLHRGAVVAAAAARKHVIIEKPLAVTLADADAMIAACDRANVKLMYAEELCFAPKYERVRQLVNEGALGRLYQLRQCEKHSGPHSDWFYDVRRSGGGALMDMGCHGIGWFRWMLGGAPKAVSVYAHLQRGLRHRGRTAAEENSVCIVEFDGGVIGVAENSWAKPGGMEDRVEVYGTGGLAYAPVHGQLGADVQRGRVWLRDGEGRLHEGVDIHDLRGGLQPRVPAGAPPLHRVRRPRCPAESDGT